MFMLNMNDDEYDHDDTALLWAQHIHQLLNPYFISDLLNVVGTANSK